MQKCGNDKSQMKSESESPLPRMKVGKQIELFEPIKFSHPLNVPIRPQ